MNFCGADRYRRSLGVRARSHVRSFEPLELRQLLTASTFTWQPSASVAPPLPAQSIPVQLFAAGPISANGSHSPPSLIPSQIRQAYGINNIRFANNIVGDGTGQTIAIVDAYNDPNIASDLVAFDAQFGLPNPTLNIAEETGITDSGSSGWSVEESLDVEWAHALAPGASILLVEASAPDINLYEGVQFAASQPGVSVVSMSWGGGEFNGEGGLDSVFSASGVTFVASTGDSGSPGEYPAYSPNVLAVGGTLFSPNPLNSAGDYATEAGWSGSGGGISQYETHPSFQNGIVTQSSSFRTTPDVSMDAASPVSIYDSYDEGTTNPWAGVTGTSLSAPCWAALIAIANQGSTAIGQGNLSGPTVSSRLYGLASSNYSTNFHDVTSGSNGFSAGTGYDLVTGIGTPMAPAIESGLSGNWLTHTPSVTNAATTENTQTTSGLVITPNAADNGVVTNYQITGITDGTLYQHDGTTQIINGSFITATQGAAGLKFTPTTNSTANGSFSVQASVTASTNGLGGSLATATITVTAPSGLLGDMNGDGAVNNFDISPFELALTNPSAYTAAFPTITDYATRGDINQNGSFDNFDINPFETLLTSNGAPPVTSAAALVPNTNTPTVAPSQSLVFTPVTASTSFATITTGSTCNESARSSILMAENRSWTARPAATIDDALLELLTHSRRG